MELLQDGPMKWMLTVGNLFFLFSAFLFLIYLVQVQSFTTRTKKYKFVSEREIKAMQGFSILFSISIAFYTFVLLGLSFNINTGFQYFIAGVFGVGLELLWGIFYGHIWPTIIRLSLKNG